MINRLRIATSFLLLAASALCGCHSVPPDVPAQAAVPAQSPPTITDSTPIPAAPNGQTPLKDALTSLLVGSGASPFPVGTRLIGVDLKESVATLDFSKEFNALANSGDSVEAAAQKSLRSALAKFPEVQKMRVTVEGKGFDSQNTDWSTPFPVRDGAQTTGGAAQGGGQ